jgi:hypothetical protein
MPQGAPNGWGDSRSFPLPPLSVPSSVFQSQPWSDLLNRVHTEFFIMINLVITSRPVRLNRWSLPSHDWVVHKVSDLQGSVGHKVKIQKITR